MSSGCPLTISDQDIGVRLPNAESPSIRIAEDQQRCSLFRAVAEIALLESRLHGVSSR